MEVRAYALIQLAVLVTLGIVSVSIVNIRPVSTYEYSVRELLAEIWVATNTPGYKRIVTLHLDERLIVKNGTIVLSREFWVLSPFNQSGRIVWVPIAVREPLVLEGLVVLKIESTNNGTVLVEKEATG